LFAYLSGSSFVLINVLGMTTTAFGYALATMVCGYLIGTLVCRRLVSRAALQDVIRVGALVQVAAGGVLALLALAGFHAPAAIIVPMFFYGISHGILQTPSQAGAVAPFADAAGAAAALLGFVMMLTAALVGVWIGVSFNGTVYPLTLTIATASVISILLASTIVRRHGSVAHHG
jgi:DHA1 family bicyclomycin/chloramphenicol resistance-like MFS transporter